MSDHIWIIMVKKLNNEASSAELQEFRQFCTENPEIQVVYDEIKDYWTAQQKNDEDPLLLERHIKRLQAADPTFALSSSDNCVPNTDEQRKSSFFYLYKKYFTIAAAFIVLFFVGWWGVNSYKASGKIIFAQKQKIVNEVQTRAGSRSKLVLPDGTQVWVNSSTQLSYEPDFGELHRNVVLNGEAYFIVAENTDLPFEIETKSIIIKVTGTTFNVRAYDDETKTETSLFQGSVLVTHKNNPEKVYVLKPQDKLIVEDQNMVRGFQELLPQKNGLPATNANKTVTDKIELGKIAYDPIDSIAMETAWVFSRLAFNDESFEEIAHKMEKWYGVNIVFESEALKRIRFTGKFKTESIQEALEALQFTSAFRFKRIDNQFIIY